MGLKCTIHSPEEFQKFLGAVQKAVAEELDKQGIKPGDGLAWQLHENSWEKKVRLYFEIKVRSYNSDYDVEFVGIKPDGCGPDGAYLNNNKETP